MISPAALPTKWGEAHCAKKIGLNQRDRKKKNLFFHIKDSNRMKNSNSKTTPPSFKCCFHCNRRVGFFWM